MMAIPAAPTPRTEPLAPTAAIRRHFRPLRDPRRAHRRRHPLLDIVVTAICAVLCGANTWPEVATWAQRRQQWLRRFLALPNGVPSHDTFERVFDRIDPAAFQACFRSWVAAACAALRLPHVAIDGKTLRRSGTSPLGPLHVVSAWATANRLALGEVTVAEKSNEITAIPRLLDLLDVSGALVTVDREGQPAAPAGRHRGLLPRGPRQGDRRRAPVGVAVAGAGARPHGAAQLCRVARPGRAARPGGLAGLVRGRPVHEPADGRG
jgi:hypothetical protein